MLNASAILEGTELGILIFNFSIEDNLIKNSVTTIASIIARNRPCTPVKFLDKASAIVTTSPFSKVIDTCLAHKDT